MHSIENEFDNNKLNLIQACPRSFVNGAARFRHYLTDHLFIYGAVLIITIIVIVLTFTGNMYFLDNSNIDTLILTAP